MSDGYTTKILHGLDPARSRCESELLAQGIALPLQSRLAWAEAHPGTPSRFLALYDAGGVCRGGFALELARSRALPGHAILRARRVGLAMGETGWAVAASALARHARADARILSVTVELFSRDAAARGIPRRWLAAEGFTRVAEPREYTHTILAELAGDEEAHLAALGYSARRKIREIRKHPLVIRPVTDPAEEPRMQALIRETMARTGGSQRVPGLAPVIALSAAHPDLSCLLGLYRTDRSGPESLLAFAWGCHHGDHAAYDLGASTRDTGPGRLSLGYPLIWELMCWARRQGAAWFDLGGITAGSFGSGDPLGGISDFKRAFAKEVVEVGEEWVLEPHPARARLARGVSGGAALLSRLRASLAPAAAQSA